jgi:hypothetical protein
LVDTVLVVEVYRLDSQPSKAPLNISPNIRWPSIESALLRIGRVGDDTELGGDKNFVPPPTKCLPHQYFIGVRAVRVGRIQKVDAEFQGAIDGGERLLFLAASEQLTHAHAAEPMAETSGPLSSNLRVFITSSPVAVR